MNKKSFVLCETITEKMIDSFAELTGDNNPIHLSDEYASKTRFKKRIAHGFLYGSFISRALGSHFPGPGTIYIKQEMNFLAPVFIGDELEVFVEILSIEKEKIACLRTTVTNQDKIQVLSGEATVLLPAGFLKEGNTV